MTLVSSMVEHQAEDLGVAGSNPVPNTTQCRLITDAKRFDNVTRAGRREVVVSVVRHGGMSC